MKKVLFLLFVLSFNFASFAESHEGAEKKTTKTIVGKITDTTGESVPGAKIIIHQTGETFFADLDGNFKITLSGDKDYSISINTIGYEPLELKSSRLSPFSDFCLISL